LCAQARVCAYSVVLFLFTMHTSAFVVGILIIIIKRNIVKPLRSLTHSRIHCAANTRKSIKYIYTIWFVLIIHYYTRINYYYIIRYYNQLRLKITLNSLFLMRADYVRKLPISSLIFVTVSNNTMFSYRNHWNAYN